MSRTDLDREDLTITESETAVKRPPLYKVLLHNDDFTTMEFVVHVLTSIFSLAEDDAVRIMLKVHLEGVGIAGVFTFEIAEMKLAQVTNLARENEYPLLCTMEEDL
jgi:ATP-dependent Clp protease adaptor protein ClpS